MSNSICLYHFKVKNKNYCSITMEKCEDSKCPNYVNLEDIREFLKDEPARNALLNTIEKSKAIKKCKVDCTMCAYCHSLGETMIIDENNKFECICTNRDRFSSMVHERGVVQAINSMSLFSDSLKCYAANCLYYKYKVDSTVEKIDNISEQVDNLVDEEKPIEDINKSKPEVYKKEPVAKIGIPIKLRTKDDPIPRKSEMKNKDIPSVDTNAYKASTETHNKTVGVNARGAALISKKNVK